MEQKKNKTSELQTVLLEKGLLKQEVYRNTCSTFKKVKQEITTLTDNLRENISEEGKILPIEYRDRGEFEIEMKFAGDILVFFMHTNIFEFPRNHEVMKTSYIKEDLARSYCGVINIFNFLADSFKYRRMNDAGYLIGRIFINKDMHYFIEGKREIGFLYNNFNSAKITSGSIRDIIISAMHYTVNFDLLVPPFDKIKEVSVDEMFTALKYMKIKTAKRLGFQFSQDRDD